MKTNFQNRVILIILLGLLTGGVTLLLAVLTAAPAQALPPRETPTPAHNNDDDDDDGPSTPPGAYIMLQVSGGDTPPNVWSEVQWQDSNGDWQTVQGWRGPLAQNQRWWVAAKDFNTGPFRWAVTRQPAGTLVAASRPFTLPGQPNQTRRVTVQLP